jgi:hypothetical protein
MDCSSVEEWPGFLLSRKPLYINPNARVIEIIRFALRTEDLSIFSLQRGDGY